MLNKKHWSCRNVCAGLQHELPFLLTGCFAIFKMFNLLVVCSPMRNASVCVCVCVCVCECVFVYVSVCT